MSGYAETMLSMVAFASDCAFAAISGPYAIPSGEDKFHRMMLRNVDRYGATKVRWSILDPAAAGNNDVF